MRCQFSIAALHRKRWVGVIGPITSGGISWPTVTSSKKSCFFSLSSCAVVIGPSSTADRRGPENAQDFVVLVGVSRFRRHDQHARAVFRHAFLDVRPACLREDAIAELGILANLDLVAGVQ